VRPIGAPWWPRAGAAPDDGAVTTFDPSPVLITGCSSGIGEAIAGLLVGRGHVVYATARDASTLDLLERAGCRVLALDVTDEDSMAAAVGEVVAEHGYVGTLINNAGYGSYGAVEEVPLDEVRRQFETNVFGLTRLTQLVLPSMRGRGHGRIVNISSMGGRLTFPFGGFYHATKHAVEAISDALRFEVAPFGVDVVVVEPGLITTRFGQTAAGTMSAATSARSPYRGAVDSLDASIAKAYRNPRISAPPLAVAEVVGAALTAERPRTRYVVTPAARALVTARALSPGRAWDFVLARGFKA
jgi:NAD(P)-dependent dehydrogenase (short-subunit alcohol dehydrogenase family)